MNFAHLLLLLHVVSGENINFRPTGGVRHHALSFEDILSAYESKKSVDPISSGCAKQLNELIKNHDEALVKMADAWSKFLYSGLIYESRNDYGNYDECISVKVETKASGTIFGKHCTYGLVVPDLTVGNISEMLEKAWKLSYCVPHLCTADDLNNLTKLPANLPLFNDAVCSTQEKPHVDTGAGVSIAIFISFLLLIVSSTLYDISCHMKERKPSMIFTAFSIHENGKKLLAFSKNSGDQILCFHGIKFISMWWIMSGHSAVAWTALPVMNDDWRTKWQTLNYSQYIMRAHLAVDSFFFISGFLLSYLYFKNELSRRPFVTQLKAVPSMVVHRYLRLTPAVLMTYLFVVYLFKYTGDGPLFAYRVNGALTEPCKNHWWAVFLYIQNYYIFHLGEELCITPLWYLCADMQLFLVAPLVIIPVALLHRRSFKLALAALFGLNALFIGVAIFTKLTWRDYDPTFNEYDAHSRLTDYFIGVTMGVFMRRQKVKRTEIGRKTNVLIWLLALILMLGVVMATQEADLHYGYVTKALCFSFARPVWCLSLCWITYACFTGHGGFINWLLSNNFMQLGGKLTYCLYLVHGPIITHHALIIRNRRRFSDYSLFLDWAGHFVICMAIATLWIMAFELPMVTIEKVIFGYRLKTVAKTQNK